MNDPAKVIAAIGFFGTVAYIARGAFQLIAKWIDSRRDGLPAAAVDERLARIEQAVDATAGLRRDRDHGRALAQAAVELGL